MMDIREPILSVLFEPVDETSGKKLERMIAIVNGANWVAKIDLTSLQHGSSSPSSLPIVRRDADKKRARDEDDGTITLAQSAASKVEIKITRRYQPLVLFDFVGQGEMVAVERLWYDLARDLPEAWVKSGEFGS
jgi:U3 small nucleolar RNA-associated protein 4